MDGPPQIPAGAIDPARAHALAGYRSQLIELEQKSQATYDRTLVSLSGGALGVSFAFVKDFLGTTTPAAAGAIGLAWGFWVVSMTVMLMSHFFSVRASRKALKQVDEGRTGETVGGSWSTAIDVLNVGGAIAFVAGLVAAGCFVYQNL